MRYRGAYGSSDVSIATRHIDEDEFLEFHNRIAFVMRMFGLRGRALDEAIAGAVAIGIAVAERERIHDEKRRASIHEVAA